MGDPKEIPLEAKFFAFLFQAIRAVSQGAFPAANKLIEFVLRLADDAPSSDADAFRALGFCAKTYSLEKEGRRDEAVQVREEAMAWVQRVSNEDARRSSPFPELMSALLVDLHEYRRAIPFCEMAVQQALEANEPISVAQMLSRQGHCYSVCGLKDQAAVPLRAALKILRGYPEEPSLTEVLIGLGNALRKSTPSEAELLYKEVAEIHMAKAHLESASGAWMNLGVLYSEQERNSEALHYYQKALEIREIVPNIPPVQIAMVVNNIANCHRRSKDFAEALLLIDRAIKMLEGENSPKIASLYGTKGQILHDAGDDRGAVEWLRKSYEERRKQSSPNYDFIVENLGFEIISLNRLGRSEEVTDSEEKLAMAKEAMKAFPDARVELSALSADRAGAVLIELPFGLRASGRYNKQDASTALEQMFFLLSEAKLAESGGRALAPDSITLMFYGENAEAMFEKIEQFLNDHLIFAGAIVSIRQGMSVRQTVVSAVLN